ncbi:MAG TPA: GAF domain-containing sensor histidine kinase [Ktedonobacteraceae bacterium]|nr:GAF domain-containing sensor histidine kinase [Ktedonobacteraceae bacterium]
MLQKNTVDSQKERRSFQQAFATLLTLIEALSSITGQEEIAMLTSESEADPVNIAGQSLAEITRQALGCQYVAVIGLSSPDYTQRLLGVSGLTYEQEQRYRADADHTTLADYMSTATIASLRNDQAAAIDLQKQPFATPRSTFGIRYRLIAPMILRGELMGLFTMAKAEAQEHDHEIYTTEEIALAKGIAKLAAQVIERAQLLQERACGLANEHALQETNRRYDDFLAEASHELRNPLTSIKGNLQLCLRRIVPLTQQHQEITLPEDALQRFQHRLEEALLSLGKLDRIINELLDFSRIQVNRLVMLKKPGNLAQIVQNAVNDMQHAAPERELRLSLPIEKILPVIVDADRISQVVNNYLTNALKYSPADQPVEIHVTKEGLLAYVSVHDKGPGLPIEEQSRIWERFYRVPGVKILDASRLDANLGLGLHLCREIVERHHGHVGVTSLANRGSTFWFALPLASSYEKI